MYMCTSVGVGVCMRACVCVQVYICVCVCVCVCTSIDLCKTTHEGSGFCSNIFTNQHTHDKKCT